MIHRTATGKRERSREMLGMRAAAGAAAAWLFVVGCASAPPAEPAQLPADPPVVAEDPGAPASSSPGLQRGIALIKEDKLAEAKPHIEEAVAAQPKNVEARYYLGLVKERTGDKAGAEEAYKAALELDPGFVEAAANLAAVYLDEPPRPDEAIKLLERSLAKAPDDSRLLQNLGFAYGLKGDVDAASKHYDKALAKADSPALRFAYGAMLIEAKQLEKGAVHLKKAMDGFSSDAATLATIGRMLGFAKQFGDCVTAFDRAIKLKATEPELYVRRGTCRHELADEAGARADYQAAIEADPKFAAAHYYLGLSLLSEKKRDEAIAALEKAASLGGDGSIGKAAKEKLAAVKKGGKGK